jgi:hypothetical protein
MFLIFRSCPSLIPEHRFMLTYEGSISEQATRKKKKKTFLNKPAISVHCKCTALIAIGVQGQGGERAGTAI